MFGSGGVEEADEESGDNGTSEEAGNDAAGRGGRG